MAVFRVEKNSGYTVMFLAQPVASAPDVGQTDTLLSVSSRTAGAP